MSDTPLAIEQLGQVFGPSIGIYVSECRNGGFVLVIDGAIHSAWTHGWEVSEAIGQAMAAQYNKPFTLPERARDVTGNVDQTLVENDRSLDDAARMARPPAMQMPPMPATAASTVTRLRQTITAIAVALLIGFASMPKNWMPSW